MSDLNTDEHFTDGQSRINASNMNGIVSRAKVQPDVISNKPESATLNVADYILVLKTDNTLAKAKFSTIVNSTGSALPLASTTANGMLKQVTGRTTDFVDGTNNCQPISGIIPPGVVWEFAGPTIPTGWLNCQGQAISRTTYAALYAAIGGYYGVGDGSTTFNVPNCAGRLVGTVGGSFGTLATSGGAGTMTLAGGHLPSHAHAITDQQHIHATVAHTHFDNGHTHSATQGLTVVGLQAGGATMYNPAASNTGVGYASLTNAAPNTDYRYTGITGTQAYGSGVAFSILNPFIVMNRMIKT